MASTRKPQNGEPAPAKRPPRDSQPTARTTRENGVWRHLALGGVGRQVQAKLTIGAAHDPLEREADRVADAVVQGSAPRLASPGATTGAALQRVCSECEEEQVQRAGEGEPPSPSPDLETHLQASTAGGTPLAPEPRADMEKSFGTSFERVRIHADGAAASLAQSIGARAFTHGDHVYFGRGQYAPASPGGRHLLAHELTHTLQQSGHAGAAPSAIQKQDDPPPPLRSVIFRSSSRIVRAYEGGTLDLGPGGNAASITLLEQALMYVDPDAYDVGASNGTFSTATADAVARFQDDHGLPRTTDGRVDPATLYALDAAVFAREGTETNHATQPGGAQETRFAGYPATYISRIDVDVGTQEVTLTWAGPEAARRDRGPFHSSPGVGMTSTTCHDCDDTTVSNTPGTNCTPKGTFTVESTAPALPSYPEALFVTFFQQARGVAFHYYPNVPTSPASHGCVRMNLYPAMLIQSNIRTNVTTVDVSGTWDRALIDDLECRRRDAADWLDERRREAGDIWDDWNPF